MRIWLAFILLLLLALGISWICTCGIFYLICLCFSLTFSWLTATGVWLVLCLIGTPVVITTRNK